MITQAVGMDRRAWARQGDHSSQMGALGGLDRRTVKTPLQRTQPPVYRRSLRSSTGDAFRPGIAYWLVRAPGLRATRLDRDVPPPDGGPGSSPMGPRRVRRRRPPRPVDAPGRCDTAAGHHAHVDWRDADVHCGPPPGPLDAWQRMLGYSRDA
jgi:hypothetical protein